MDWLSAVQLTQSNLETYVGLNVALEEDGKTSNQGHMSTFVVFFSESSSLQFSVV